MQREEIHSIVERVLARVHAGEMPAAHEVPANPHGVYKTVGECVDAARTSQRVLINLPLEKRREIIANIRRRAAEDVHTLARMAFEETGLGRTEDKVKKNLLVIHRTPGPEILQPTAWTGDGVTFGIHCDEKHPTKLRMDNANRDDGTLWFQDCVEVFLEPSGKGDGKVAQLLITAGGGLFDSWGGDSGWTCEGLKFTKHLGEDFWSMEVYVPLKALPGAVAPATGVQWNGQFTRFRSGHGKPDKDSEAQKMNAKYGGFNSNTADFAPIRFQE